MSNGHIIINTEGDYSVHSEYVIIPMKKLGIILEIDIMRLCTSDTCLEAQYEEGIMIESTMQMDHVIADGSRYKCTKN